jgi:hypothetical protein
MITAPIWLYGGMALLANSLAAVAFVSLFWFLRGVSMPIVSDYVQRECTKGNRATVLSANALTGRVVFSIVSPFLGWVTDVWSFQTAFAAASIVFGVIALIGYMNWLIAVRTQKT